jgi:sugar lactone lactonase YvrE
MDPKALRITLQQGHPEREAAAALPPITGPQHYFRGDAASPLLAPRGVCLADGRLIVADTGQNRVFVWDDYPALVASQQATAPAAVVLGQADHHGTGRNAGGAAAADSLHYPSGIWSDGQRLIVADAWNHRVLIWHEFPTTAGQPADTVVGQPDFTTCEPNVDGIGAPPSARSLNWPYGLTSDGTRLWIADTGNRRILVYDRLPTENYAAADAVIGKPSFTERDYASEDPIWPYSVKISAAGAMVVADTQYYRCLLWRDWRTALTQRADQLIGQPDLGSNGMNQYDLFPRADTLSWCYDACFYENGLWVADTGNSRVLWFDSWPERAAPPATNLVGKPHFRVGSENAATVFGTEAELYWPFSISIENNWLALADTGNHRLALQQILL